MSPRFDPANGSVKSESAFQKRNRNIGNVSKSFGKDINDKSSSPGKIHGKSAVLFAIAADECRDADLMPPENT